MTSDSGAGISRIQFGAGTSSGPADPQGRTIIADAVVAKIAGLATREISGVIEVGAGTARVVGALRDRIPGARINTDRVSPSRSVSVRPRSTSASSPNTALRCTNSPSPSGTTSSPRSSA